MTSHRLLNSRDTSVLKSQQDVADLISGPSLVCIDQDSSSALEMAGDRTCIQRFAFRLDDPDFQLEQSVTAFGDRLLAILDRTAKVI